MPASAATADRARWLALAVVCFAQFMVVLDATVTNVALPAIQEDLGLTGSQLQWVINAYTLIFGGFLLLGGRAADLLGRRRLFIAGTVLFTFASLLNGLAESGTMLIVSRALQGLGGALVSPAALSIVTTTFPEGPERTKAMGVWGAIAAGGGGVGLLLGGVLTEAISWQWIFFVNVPIGVGVVIAALRLVPESRDEHAHRSFDLAGAVTVTAGLVLLVYAIVEAEGAGWASTQTVILGAIAALLLAGFAAIERRSAEPLVRLGIFRLRSLAVSNTLMLVVAGAMFANFFFVSLYVQQVLGFSALEAGVGFLPFTGGILVGSVLAQMIIKRAGIKASLVAGMVLATGGMVLMTQLEVGGSYAADLLPAMLPMAVGMGLVFVPLTLAGTANVGSADAGLASGLFNTSQQVGGALGLAVLATLANDRTADALAATGPDGRLSALVEGFQVAFAAGAGLLAFGTVVLLLLLRRRDVANVDATAEPALAAA